MIGECLEKLGWRQGSIVKDNDTNLILEKCDRENDGSKRSVIVVASQSCDIANNDLDSEPFIELSIAQVIAKSNGSYTHNKNPRILHTTLQIRTEDISISDQIFIEFKAFDKVLLRKEFFKLLSPDPVRLLVNGQLEGYVSWLAARYSRPDLPTEFNNRIASKDPKDKRRKKAKIVNEELSGIYIAITPDAEITLDQNYKVNLLGLVSADFDGDISKAESAIDDYANIMRQAGMDVTVAVRREDQVSIAAIKKFKRFYYDDLSLKNNTPLPPETQINL